jgi:hypothetical protein
MRIKLTVAVLAVVLSLSYPAASSQNASPEPQSKSDEVLLQRIQAADSSAIAEAGRSGNRLFVAPLRQLLRNRTNKPEISGYVRVALARLGEQDQLQEIWCRAITDDPKRGLYPSTYELESVAGWFGIQGLERLLTPDVVRWHKLSEKEKNNDALAEPLSLTALKALPKVIPNPPAQFTEKEWKQQVKAWRQWIDAHKDELSKLQPTGEGVDFSPNACKNGKPLKKH